jgi:hypothetical protein
MAWIQALDAASDKAAVKADAQRVVASDLKQAEQGKDEVKPPYTPPPLYSCVDTAAGIVGASNGANIPAATCVCPSTKSGTITRFRVKNR